MGGFGSFLSGLVNKFFGGGQPQAQANSAQANMNQIKFGGNAFSNTPVISLKSNPNAGKAYAAEPTPQPTAPPQQFGNILKSQIPQNIQQMATPIFQQYQIPPQVGFGQLAIEGHGTHKYSQAPYNNPYDIGAYDSNPDNAVRYDNLQKGIEAYAKLMSGKYELGHIGSGNFDTRYAHAYQLRNNPQAMLQEVAKVGYASNPHYAQDVMNTPEWQYYNGR